ncbi:hypothetical protein CMEL01_16694 [Colletotrichum melonis]|uniref:Uncharacterized protein n=1 Tax=Colletotrichum melonis TaxID=1209925 RepID=A0AAI9XLW3_9PEZI|nr:hypothetical protein CMEL01_16694 [Colletotrichum melonis]
MLRAGKPRLLQLLCRDSELPRYGNAKNSRAQSRPEDGERRADGGQIDLHRRQYGGYAGVPARIQIGICAGPAAADGYETEEGDDVDAARRSAPQTTAITPRAAMLGREDASGLPARGIVSAMAETAMSRAMFVATWLMYVPEKTAGSSEPNPHAASAFAPTSQWADSGRHGNHAMAE